MMIRCTSKVEYPEGYKDNIARAGHRIRFQRLLDAARLLYDDGYIAEKAMIKIVNEIYLQARKMSFKPADIYYEDMYQL